MIPDSDPRSQGFNYGVGWGADPKPPVYHTASATARELGHISRKYGDLAWELQMLLRNVRLASNAVEKTRSVAHLEVQLWYFEAYLREALTVLCASEAASVEAA